IYVQREQRTDGPYSLEQLWELLDNGVVTFNDNVWVEGTANWVTLNQVDGIYARPAPELNAIPVEEGTQTRPWVRYWARSIDTLLISYIVVITFDFILPGARHTGFVIQSRHFLALALWVPIEACLLATFGYTPGKALLRVRVTNKDGSDLRINQALSRSFEVWWKGLGTGLIPLVTTITYLVAYSRLSNKGVQIGIETGASR